MKNLLLEIHFANITNKSCSWRKSLPLWGQSIGEVQRWKEAAINDSRTAHQTKRQGKPHLVHNKYKQKYKQIRIDVQKPILAQRSLNWWRHQNQRGPQGNEWWHRDAHKTRKIKSRPIWRKEGRQFSFFYFPESFLFSVCLAVSCPPATDDLMLPRSDR